MKNEEHELKPGPVPDDFLILIGELLLNVQSFEGLLTFIVDAVLERDHEQARRNLLQEDPRTCGRLLSALRRKVDVKPAFDELLGRALQGRNIFVHNLQERFDLTTSDGLSAFCGYMDGFQTDLFEASNVFKVLILMFRRSRGVKDPPLEREWRAHGDLRLLEERYLPHLSRYLVLRQ